MITEDYQRQLVEVRERDENNGLRWGASGGRNFGATLVAFIRRRSQVISILDFGCGHGTLKMYVDEHLEASPLKDGRKLEWTEYDPGMPGKDIPPEGTFDLIVSTDVLEHVEPDQIDAALEWCTAHSKRQFHWISCSNSTKLLPDGRSVHLIVEPLEWWMKKFDWPGWDIQSYSAHWNRKRERWGKYCCIQTDKLG